MTTKSNSQRCPLCEQQNNCQVDAQTCWCARVKLDLVKLRNLLGEERSKCICNNCIQRLALFEREHS